MSNLKSMVAKSNEGLSRREKSKHRFGLESFLAASTDQMLMTRGGYGAGGNGQSCKHGFSYCGTCSQSSGGGTPYPAVNALGNSWVQSINNMSNSFANSTVGQAINGTLNAVSNLASTAWSFAPNVFDHVVGKLNNVNGVIFIPSLVSPPSSTTNTNQPKKN